VRPLVIEADTVHGGVGGVGVEPAGIDERDFAPCVDVDRRDVLPILAAVSGDVDEAIVGSGPDRVHVLVGRRYGIDDAAARLARQVGRPEDADALGTSGDSRDRSGLMISQLCPPLTVLKSTFAPSSSMCGSTGEKSSGRCAEIDTCR